MFGKSDPVGPDGPVLCCPGLGGRPDGQIQQREGRCSECGCPVHCRQPRRGKDGLGREPGALRHGGPSAGSAAETGRPGGLPGAHTQGDSLSSLLAYQKALVQFTSEQVARANSEVKTAASWYVRSEYEIKSASPRYLSYIQKTTTYLGGAHDNVVWTAGNYDLATGKAVTLAELFVPDGNYQNRLSTLISWQQAGLTRLKAYRTGRTPAPVRAVSVTGTEQFSWIRNAIWGFSTTPAKLRPCRKGSSSTTCR